MSDSGNVSDSGNRMDSYFLDYGDWVEHRCNANVTGVVIGRSGSTVHVRLSPSLILRDFQDCELRLIDDDDEYVDPDDGEENVIHVDFSKRTKLDDAKPKGAA